MFIFKCMFIFSSSLTLINAAIFEIRNNCPYTVWAASVPVGGGIQLNPNSNWTIYVPPGTSRARVWARTGCNFDDSGRGKCQTGDCNGLLRCESYGLPPNSLAEYSLNQDNNLDFFDVSFIAGFNVPIEFSPTSNGCTRGIRCSVDINMICPCVLKTRGGCNNPCTIFKTDQYCCYSGKCDPTIYSSVFKERCYDAYSYPKDGKINIFTCPGGTNYKVVFSP